MRKKEVDEIRSLISKARACKAKMVQELNGSDNPCVVKTRDEAQAQVAVMDDILAAFQGVTAPLRIMGERS